jgi:hypothetical protein
VGMNGKVGKKRLNQNLAQDVNLMNGIQNLNLKGGLKNEK